MARFCELLHNLFRTFKIGALHHRNKQCLIKLCKSE